MYYPHADTDFLVFVSAWDYTEAKGYEYIFRSVILRRQYFSGRKHERRKMYDLTQLLAFFMFYAVVGWCVEVVYHAVTTGRFINRGFLNGPVCPIYGVGAVIVILALTPLEDSLLLLYAGSVVLTSALEFITGFILEKIFHQRWWDYTDEHFNIMGYVCLRFSLMWGFGCVFVMRIVQPVVILTVEKIPETLRNISFIAYYGLFFIDMIITVAALAKIQARLRLANDADRLLNRIAEIIGSRLTTGTLKSMQEIKEQKERLEDIKNKAGETTTELTERYEDFKHRAEEKTAELTGRYGDFRKKAEEKASQLEKRYEELRNKAVSCHRLGNWDRLSFVQKRLEKAYPTLDLKRLGHINMSEKLKKLRERLEENKDKADTLK